MRHLFGYKKHGKSLFYVRAHFRNKKWGRTTRSVTLGLTAVMLFSFVISAISPLIASAVTTTSSMTQIADQARSFADLNGLYDCFTKSNAQMDDASLYSTRNRISAPHVKSGDWWATTASINKVQSDGAKTAGSFLNSKTDPGDATSGGATLCNDVLKDALSVWGFKDGLDFMCSIIIPGQQTTGVPRGYGSSCQTGSDTDWNLDGYADDMWATIKKVIYNGAEPKFADSAANVDAAKYLIYRQAFLLGCHPVVSSTASADTKYSNIVVIDDNGKPTTKTYEGYSHGTNKDVYRVKGERNDTENCGDIATNVNRYAPKYQAYRDAHPNDTGATAPPSILGGGGGSATATSCVIDGVGWIVCSVANFFATVSDGIYSLVANLLRVPKINTDTSSGGNGVYNAWVIMRNLANVAFVIAFLIIIFSQLTSLGVSNYGVKKTLPRLVVAAILVNLSFWISAIAVDISNILGAGIYDLMSGVKDNMNISISTNWGNIIGGLLAGGAVSGLVIAGAVGATAAVAAAGGGMAILFLALPLLLSAVLAVLIAALVLVARQALVVILIIISPLAFVALLLPNTEKLFAKWRSALVSMLLMYPIISLIFGGAQIAGLAIMSTAAKTTDASSTALAILVGQTVMVIPFFFIPTLVMKFSGDSLKGLTSSMMSRGKGLIGGISGVARKEGRARMGTALNTMKYGENVPRGRLAGAFRKYGRKFDQSIDRRGMADSTLNESRQTTTRKRLGTDSVFATGAGAGSYDVGQQVASRAQAAAEADELKKALQPLVRELAGMDPGNKGKHLDTEVAAGGARAAAALHYSASIGDDSFLRKHIDAAKSSGNAELSRQSFEAVQSNSGALLGKAPDLVKGADAAFKSLKGAQLATMSEGGMQALANHIQSLSTTASTTTDPAEAAAATLKLDTAIAGLNSAAEDVANDVQLQSNFTGTSGLALKNATAGFSPTLQVRIQPALDRIKGDGKIRP